jgi:hypothetical protein
MRLSAVLLCDVKWRSVMLNCHFAIYHKLATMMTLDDVLERWIPYRLQALETLQFAWKWIGETEAPRKVEVFVEGRLTLQGNVAAIANPMIEVGLIHARALLEFLGLCAVNGKLRQITKRRPDDLAVEYFSTAQFPLSIVSPDSALSAYQGPMGEAEKALVSIFEFTNKGLAHMTTGVLSQEYTEQHLEIACRGLPVLLHNHLYAKLGREIPTPLSAAPKNGG